VELLSLLQQTADGRLAVQEALPGPDDAWLPGPDGGYLSEVVVPLLRTDLAAATPAAVPQPAAAVPPPVARAQRSQPPGSRWLYARLACPPLLQDDLIAGPLLDRAEELTAQGVIDRWFFVRYRDPRPELRVRFRAAPATPVGDLLAGGLEWTSRMVDEGRCASMSVDTYEREVERYGGLAGMDVAEHVFTVDSRAVAQLLRAYRGLDTDDERLLLTALSLDHLLDGLGCAPAARTAGYRAGHPAGRSADPRYRPLTRQLRPLLGRPELPAGTARWEPASAVIADRAARLRPLGADLHRLASAGELHRSVGAMYADYAHMHCNRLLGTDRPNEHLVLDVLYRVRHGIELSPVRREGALGDRT
jgi:thiopeptide-type bacteriocin biosynthesis protein